ncbi:MAG: RNA polymerase sporulation sigma factor SigK [Bacillota bacterium]|nr:RNA polymerase sporulation sigma factor SigK [Bacillota bacterium]
MGAAATFLAAGFLRWALWLLGYVAANNTFPHPLSEDEEAAYLKRLMVGDHDARNVLIERNLRLVAHIVKKFDNSFEDTDDLISIGTYGLIKAINTFKLDKGTRLATYAARCIENEILMHLRATKRAKSEVSLYDPIGVDREGNEITLMDVLELRPGDDIVDRVSQEMDRQRLVHHLTCLDSKERVVLELRYGLFGKIARTQREIARLLGISRSYVSRIEKKAVYKLWRELKAEES